MEGRRFGPIKREIAVIGQGNWSIDTDDRASAVAGLRRGLDLGMNHIDTAEMYGHEEVKSVSVVRTADPAQLSPNREDQSVTEPVRSPGDQR